WFGCSERRFGVACALVMARSADPRAALLILFASLALAYGIQQLSVASEIRGLYWLIAGGLGLRAANDRERFLASR
ncbi:MAG TPA: hypothetical protein VFQ61_09770, partial [Polyangiaceae bacterium]|nr:hypothetical protein [Polyangiaceae bacterium]